MENSRIPLSRAGKATITMYRAFQDWDKHKNVESKVAKMIGRGKKQEEERVNNDSDLEDINQ